jgi:multidrug efflux pump subunit AcrB
MSSTKIPVMEIHVTGSVSEETLRRVVRQLEDGLRAVQGVSGVEKVGYRNREVRILLNPDRLQQLGISYGQITQAIAKRNVRDAGGSLDSFLAEKKVLTIGQFEAPKDVEEVIIHSAGIGDYVRLRDVADIVLDYDDWQVQTRTDGKVSIVLLPRKKVMADGVKTSKAVRSYVKEFQRSAPPGVKLVMVNDISRFTYDMLDTLADVTRAVRIAFDGVIINELQTVVEKIEYRLQFRPQEKGKMETLRRLVLINQHGRPVLLRSVAEFEIQPGTAAIKHYFGERTLTVFADIDRKKISVGEINANLASFIE